MFYNCSSLISLPDISKWNTNNITNIRYIFSECISLSHLSDLSKCLSLIYLPEVTDKYSIKDNPFNPFRRKKKRRIYN